MLQFFKKIKGLKEYKTSAAITGKMELLLGPREKTEKCLIIQQTEYKTLLQLLFLCGILIKLNTLNTLPLRLR